MCNLDKPLDEFHQHKLGRSGVNSTCKQCHSALSRARREDAAIRERERDQKRVRLFGLRLGQYDEMLAAQGGGCAICHNSHEDNRSLHVDHDHVTGAVRGLLCFNCNAGLGAFKDRVDLLEEAVRYLTR
jgi:recombination endonuclease VII